MMKERGEFMKVRSGPGEQETGKHRDSRQEALVVQSPLQRSHFSSKMVDRLSVAVSRGRWLAAWRSRRRCEESSRRQES